MNNNSSSHIFEYVKNRQNQPVGVVVAQKDTDGNVYIGWSKCKVTAGDKFDRQRGLQMALGRATQRGTVDHIPFSIAPSVANIISRAHRYFKTDRVFFAA